MLPESKDNINRRKELRAAEQELQDHENQLVALREEGKLCIVDEKEVEHRDPQIICSLGLKVK